MLCVSLYQHSYNARLGFNAGTMWVMVRAYEAVEVLCG